MSVQHKFDFDLQPEAVSKLTSADAVAAFLQELGYDTTCREGLSPDALRLGDTAKAVDDLELLSESGDGFLRVVFGRLRSVTAKARSAIVRAFAQDASQADYLLILTSDFDALEFVLLERESRGGNRPGIAVSHRSFVVPRRWPQQMMRIVRRLTWTMYDEPQHGQPPRPDGLRQYDKLRSVFDAAHFSGVYFQNRALFADHFLEKRLRDDPHWSADPGAAFELTRIYVGAARDRICGKGLAEARQELYDPFFPALGFRTKASAPVADGQPVADYVLCDADGNARTVALTYSWQRWLDGPDHIVQYIVENTVGPVLRRKLDALRPDFLKASAAFHRHLANVESQPTLMLGHAAAAGWRARRKKEPMARPQPADFRAFALAEAYDEHRDLVEKLFDLKVLDPAMGSGHFLVEAVDFVTDELLHFLNAFPNNPVAAALGRTRDAILESLDQQGIEVDDALRRKLTDVHLLKRHVLKRCIYGVDLNPLATELAKVSLWLDAFTLGAPLSFLDHHLRTGNSLIGSSLKELEDVLHDKLFKIDESYLKRAVQNVLTVARLADATASEVAESKKAFDAARATLAGYAVLLDILVAKYFGDTNAAAQVLEAGADLNLSGREAFLSSLRKPERELVEAVVAAAARLRFFHWDLEFPEVFYSFAGEKHARLERTPLERAGFDAVVGNPPYIRQESFKADKAYLETAFRDVYAATADIYTFFINREVRALKANGRVGLIVTNKWLRSGYGHKLRTWLPTHAAPVLLIDFGHTPVFKEADVFPCIFIAERRSLSCRQIASEDAFFGAATIDRAEYSPSRSIEEIVKAAFLRLPVSGLQAESWSLENPAAQQILQAMAASPRLSDAMRQRPLRGILTGFNEAFVVNAKVLAELQLDDQERAALVRPLLRGRDMGRWVSAASGNSLLTLWSSANRSWPWSGLSEARGWKAFENAFPGVANHMNRFESELRERQDQGRYWWELRSCDYIEAFDAPKLVWQEMAWFNRFSVDVSGSVILNTAYMMPLKEPLLSTAVSVLNSRVAWWYMWRTAQHGKDEVLRLIREYMETFPLPAVDSALSRRLKELTTKLRTLLQGTPVDFATRIALEAEIFGLIGEAYGLTVEQRSLIAATRPPRDPLEILKRQVRDASEVDESLAFEQEG